MGYYVETGTVLDKAAVLIARFGAELAPAAIPADPDTVLICVVENGWMDAAAIIYNDYELQSFADPSDTRRKTWLTLPKATVLELNPQADGVLA